MRRRRGPKKWRQHRRCERCRSEYLQTRRAQSYCSPSCRREAAYGRERFNSQTKGPRKRLLRPREASEICAPTAPKTPPGTYIARSFRKAVFSSIKTVVCRGGFGAFEGQFQWRGLALHFNERPVLTLVADETFPHLLYRIRYPDGWTSTPANITRARDAAYGHAKFLLRPADTARAA